MINIQNFLGVYCSFGPFLALFGHKFTILAHNFQFYRSLIDPRVIALISGFFGVFWGISGKFGDFGEIRGFWGISGKFGDFGEIRGNPGNSGNSARIWPPPAQFRGILRRTNKRVFW